MNKTLFCAVLAVLTAAGNAGAAPKIKVLPRMNYFTERDSVATIIVTGQQTPERTALDDSEAAVTLTKQGKNTYTLPLDALKTGDNTLRVRVGDSTYAVRLTRLPYKDNGVQIDYLTGVVRAEGLPVIPSGFYCYSPVQPTLAEEEAVRGMNLISPYQNIGKQPRKERIAYLDRAAQLGMRVNYNLLSIAGGGGGAKAAATDKTKKMELLREEIRALKDHPAILSWYVADEPEGQGISAETLEEIYDIIRAEDPYHPITLVIMSAGPGRHYANSCDIIMADTYPVPNSAAADVIGTIRGLREELQFEKSIWYVPQTFGGAEFWTREPTPAEIRMMTWGAALEGARGFQSFIRHGLNGFPKNQFMWETYAKTCREIQELTPFFERGTERAPRVASAAKLEARTYTLGKQTVAVLLNPGAEAASYKLVLPDTFNGKAYDLSDNSVREVVNGTIDGVLAPFGVQIFKLFADPAEERAFASDNRPVNGSNLLIDPSFEWQYSVSGNVPAAVYGNAGKDRGATYAIDSRVAFHGGHSLRMITPKSGQGASVSFYPLPLQLGKSYIMTVWARASEASINRLKKGEKMRFRLNLGNISSQEFELTDKWTKYELSATYTKAAREARYLNSSITLLTEGTAWFDLLEVVPDMDFSVAQDADDPRSFRVTMNNHIPEGVIRYTLDSSEPTAESTLYTEPVKISDVRVVKARVFGPDGRSYGVTEQQVAAHKALGAGVTYLKPYTKYSGGGDGALTDGRVGALRFADPAWQGFIGNDLEAVIDLGAAVPVERITAQFLHSRGDWIVPPTSVEYLLSSDGMAFESLGVIELGEAKNEPTHKVPVSKDKIGKTARYIKVIARGHGKMPAWHSKDDAWLFCDEVIVE
ncbi:chitobiase/beta-hexosaminidase C-terminal domain-containing protein [uncultured Rikenella sp.]|uniref:chitobiase/beta-hexosaminidase C-terminal domain-containing protein n=1 Tax=uncultured Rikenella sp. TaxID=368003 RepID=UPI00262E7F29|nr:chitobiase/beta-hexosaminidase C-terminal domain-containing protein [uncultured Rikenella sp.]